MSGMKNKFYSTTAATATLKSATMTTWAVIIMMFSLLLWLSNDNGGGGGRSHNNNNGSFICRYMSTLSITNSIMMAAVEAAKMHENDNNNGHFNMYVNSHNNNDNNNDDVDDVDDDDNHNIIDNNRNNNDVIIETKWTNIENLIIKFHDRLMMKQMYNRNGHNGHSYSHNRYSHGHNRNDQDDHYMEMNVFILIMKLNINHESNNRHHQQQSNRKLIINEHEKQKDVVEKQYLIEQYRHSVLTFYLILFKYDLIDLRRNIYNFYWINTLNNNGHNAKMFKYLQMHCVDFSDRKLLSKWMYGQQQKPNDYIILKLSINSHNNQTNVRIFKTEELTNSIQLLFWYGKTVRIPLMKYLELEQKKFSNTLNIMILIFSFISLILLQRKTLKQQKSFFPLILNHSMILLPVLLFPIGFVWNQINNLNLYNNDNHNGINIESIIRISKRTNSQFLSESILIFIMNLIFVYCFHYYSSIYRMKVNNDVLNDYDGNTLPSMKLKLKMEKQNSNSNYSDESNDEDNDDNSIDKQDYHHTPSPASATYLILIITMMIISFSIINSIFKMKIY